MMRSNLWWTISLGLVSSCQAGSSSPEVASNAVAGRPAPVEPVPHTSAVEAPGALAIEPPSGPVGPLLVAPRDNGDGLLPHVPHQPKNETLLTHVVEFGWAENGHAFGFCYDDLDVGTCEVHVPSGEQTEALRMDDGWDAWKARMGGIGVGPTTWPYPEVTLTWRATHAQVQVGARVEKGRGKPDIVSFPHFDEDWPEAVGMLELVSVSPDRSWIALVGHEAVGEAHNEFYVEFRRSRVFAAEAFGARGLDELRAGRYEQAATWFRKAAKTDLAWKHPYNLACALSRAEASGARDALMEAVRRGGAAVRARAQTDADLAHARTQPWFRAALGG